MQRTVVLNVVALTRRLLRGGHIPRLAALADAGASSAIEPVLPAVTCAVQTTYLTGLRPAEHGIVGNGWYFRDEAEVKFWRQADALVQRPRIWENARRLDPAFTCANLFWWFNMYSSADIAVTPRPMYPADGRKIPDLHTHPATLRDDLQRELGRFPLFKFWGPAADISSTRWIADTALYIDRARHPTLTLIYLPHLDYVLQRFDASDARVSAELLAIDTIAGELIDHYQAQGVHVLVISEYGIAPVSRPVHLNRVLRGAGLLAIRAELGREMLDAGASHAFAVADHQVAHIYVRKAGDIEHVRKIVGGTPGVARVLDREEQVAAGIDHSRSGELVALAERDAWFTYYYWFDDACAPDFARTVDIHRKPGYDPAELFINPALRTPKLFIARKLAMRKLGMRNLLDVIPLDATLVRGSHGLSPETPDDGAMIITERAEWLDGDSIPATGVHDLILKVLTQ